MISRLIKFVLIAAALVLFTACEEATPTPTLIAKATPATETVICPPDYLAAPVLTGPAPEAIVDTLTPLLTWTNPVVPYPDASSTTLCLPELNQLEILRGPFFTENIGSLLPGDTTSFTTSTLSAGGQYMWGVRGVSEGVIGPAPVYRMLYIGTGCETASLLAPELMSPADHSTISTLDPSLFWEYPGDCIPAGYQLDFSSDPTFATNNWGGELNSSDHSSRSSEILTDCARYYWRVAARSEIGGVAGPVSPVFTFRTDTGSCSEEPEVVQNGISGRVWQDLCNVPAGSAAPDPMPSGCVSNGSGGAVADGIRSTGEPGLANVMVRLASGACPGTGMGVTFTNADGFYYFEDVPAGSYCISADSADTPSVLNAGSWTAPGSGSGAVSDTLDMPDFEAYFYNVDFGWDYSEGALEEYAQLDGIVFDDVCLATLSTEPSRISEGCVMGSDGYISANGTMDTSESGIEYVQVILYRGSCIDPDKHWLGGTRTDADGAFNFLLPKTADMSDYCIGIYADMASNRTTLMPGVWTTPRTLLPDVEMDVLVESTLPMTASFGWDRRGVRIPITNLGPQYTTRIRDYCYEGPALNFKAITRLDAGFMFSIKAINPPGNWVQIDPNTQLNPSVNCLVDPSPPHRTAIDDDVSWGHNGIDDDVTWLTMIDDDVTWQRIQLGGGSELPLDVLLACELVDPNPPHRTELPLCWMQMLNGDILGDVLSLPRLTGPRIITPTPTVTVTPQQQPPSCSDFTDEPSCINHANDMGCYWNANISQCVHP